MTAETFPGIEWLEAGRAYGRQANGLRVRLKKLRHSNDIDIHPSSWANLDQPDQPTHYRKTFRFAAPSIDGNHQAINDAPSDGSARGIDLGVKGYLQRADALKLYELARFARGDVLELGTYLGLSTSIIANALAERGEGLLETVDIIRATIDQAKQNLAGRPGAEGIAFIWMEADLRMQQLVDAGRRFGFIFIDHWHGYEATANAARFLPELLTPGGFVQFHDFTDAQNVDQNHPHAVFQAVVDTVCRDGRFLFCGNYGCTGVFRFLGPARLQSV